jgi:N-methylhydantoinase A
VLIAADMKFEGQTHLIRVELPAEAVLGGTLVRERLLDLFAEAYDRRFAVRLPEIPVTLVNLQTTVIGRRPGIDPAALVPARGRPDVDGARIGTRPVWFAGRFLATPVLARDRLAPGCRFIGPAIVEQLDATTVVVPGDEARVDSFGNLILTVRSNWER